MGPLLLDSRSMGPLLLDSRSMGPLLLDSRSISPPSRRSLGRHHVPSVWGRNAAVSDEVRTDNGTVI